jgi:hypothetical protein
VRSVGRQALMRGNARNNRRKGARTGRYFGIVWNIERMVARRGRGEKREKSRDRRCYTVR